MGEAETFTPRDRVGNGITYGDIEGTKYSVPNLPVIPD